MNLASENKRQRARRAESRFGRTWTSAVVAVSVVLVASLMATTVSAGVYQPSVPFVEAGFASETYTAVEGGDAAEVTVRLNRAPRRLLVIPIESQFGGGATAQDYSGIPASVAFAADETEKSFQIVAVDDSEDDDGEFITLQFGDLPERVEPLRPVTEVMVEDDDTPEVQVSFASETYTAPEGGAPVNVTVVLSAIPEREVEVPIEVYHHGSVDEADYQIDSPSVTFRAFETRKSFQIEATYDSVNETGEAVSFVLGELPDGVSWGSPGSSTVALQDTVLPEVDVRFASTDYTAVEGGAPVEVTMVLSAIPGRRVVVPIMTSQTTGADASDYRGVPHSVIFEAHETRKSFFFEAVDDGIDESDESLWVWFQHQDLPAGVTAVHPEWSRIALHDDALPELTVSLSTRDHEIVAGGLGAEITVTLSEIPRRRVVVPLVAEVTLNTLPGDEDEIVGSLPRRAVTFESYERSKSVHFRVFSTTGGQVQIGAEGVYDEALPPDWMSPGDPFPGIPERAQVSITALPNN